MLPLLYRSSSDSWSPASMQYIGRLTKAQKCTVTESLGGVYTLSAVFAPTDALIDEIQNQRFLSVKPNPFDEPQLFELHGADYDEAGTLTVKGRHIIHGCYNNLVTSDYAEAPQSNTPEGHWNSLGFAFTNHYTFSSAVTSTAAMEIGYTKIDTIGKFLEEMKAAFSGDFHYNNFAVELLQHRGSKKNYVLRWDKNIGSPALGLTSADLYTHVVAYAKLTAVIDASSGQPERRYEVQVCSDPKRILPASVALKQRRIKAIDAGDYFISKEIHPRQNNEYAIAKALLNEAAADYVAHKALSELQTVENANLKVNYRPALDEMTAVGLGDTVDVMLKGGRTVEARITKTEYDSLAERWKSIELGEERIKLSNYIAKRR